MKSLGMNASQLRSVHTLLMGELLHSLSFMPRQTISFILCLAGIGDVVHTAKLETSC